MRINKVISIGFAVLCCVAWVGPVVAQDWTWQQVAPGVVAVLQPREERFNDANVVFIDWGDDGLIMVDAPAKADQLDRLLDQLAERTSRQVGWIINTHWHSDHTQGNAQIRQRLGNDIVIVGHETLRQDVPERAAKFVTDRIARLEEILPPAIEQLKLGRDQQGKDLNEEDLETQRQGIERAQEWLQQNRKIRFISPEVAVGAGLTLHDGELSIELLFFRAHTRGDLVVHLPDRGVLITGDVADDLPYVGHGYPSTWVEALDHMAALEPRFVIPGHGPVFDGTDQIRAVRGFINDLLVQADAVLEQADGEVDLESLASKMDLSAWRATLAQDAVGERFFDGVLAEAIERAVQDLRGELAHGVP